MLYLPNSILFRGYNLCSLPICMLIALFRQPIFIASTRRALHISWVPTSTMAEDHYKKLHHTRFPAIVEASKQHMLTTGNTSIGIKQLFSFCVLHSFAASLQTDITNAHHILNSCMSPPKDPFFAHTLMNVHIYQGSYLKVQCNAAVHHPHLADMQTKEPQTWQKCAYCNSFGLELESEGSEIHCHFYSNRALAIWAQKFCTCWPK